MGSGLAFAADWAYQTNKLGLKDKTDWVGHKIDESIEVVGKSADSVRNTVGEATKNIGKHINSMKWAW